MENFLVDVHSFSDVITNSSTDIFACKTKKSADTIRELLNAIATAARESSGLTVEEQTIKQFWDRTKDYCILGMGYDYVYDKKYDTIGWTRSDRLNRYVSSNERKADPELNEEKLFKEWVERHKHHFSSMKWKADDPSYGSDVTAETKVIVICGTEDNSIPYWLQEYIESSLNGLRYHLG